MASNNIASQLSHRMHSFTDQFVHDREGGRAWPSECLPSNSMAQLYRSQKPIPVAKTTELKQGRTASTLLLYTNLGGGNGIFHNVVNRMANWVRS